MNAAPARPQATGGDVLITQDLDSRPARPPDYEAESRALVALAESPKSVFQKLADPALHLCRAGSAGSACGSRTGTTSSAGGARRASTPRTWVARSPERPA